MGALPLIDAIFADERMAEALSDRARLQGMLDFEAALARAQARAGLFPAAQAEAIAAACRAEHYDPAALGAAAARSGNPAIPLLAALVERVGREDPRAAGWVHHGATSQDAMDTGMVLQLRAALDLLESGLARLSAALQRLARDHRATPMAGRTWLQQAEPITFGLKAAGWRSAVERQRQRLREARPRLLVLQLGGGAGTLAALGPGALDLAAQVAAELRLGLPDLPWHAHRDRVAEAGALLGLAVGTLGKLGRDLALLSQTEVAEVAEPEAPGRGGSSAMPQKRNPVAAAAALAAAARAPGLVATLLAAMLQEHERGLGGWQAEWSALPELCALAGGALAHLLHAVEGLQVDAARMARNLLATRGRIHAGAVAAALAPRLGRPAAQALLEEACRRSEAEDLPLRQALDADARVTAVLPAAALDRLLDPAAAAGPAAALVDRALAGARGGDQAVARSPLHRRIDGPADAPPLLLSPSLGTGLGLWEPQIPAFSARYRVVRYDPRGHGRSPVVPGPCSIADLGHDVLGLADELGLGRFDFCGLSIGGMVGMWLALHAPERLGRVVLCNTAARIGTPEAWDARIAAVRQGGVAAVADAALARWLTPPWAAAHPAERDRLRELLLATPPEGYAACCAAVRDMDQREAVAAIRAPVLVIAGSADVSTPPADGRWLAGRIPGAAYRELPAAHLSNVEAAEAFNEAVLGFLGGKPGA